LVVGSFIHLPGTNPLGDSFNIFLHIFGRVA